MQRETPEQLLVRVLREVTGQAPTPEAITETLVGHRAAGASGVTASYEVSDLETEDSFAGPVLMAAVFTVDFRNPSVKRTTDAASEMARLFRVGLEPTGMTKGRGTVLDESTIHDATVKTFRRILTVRVRR